MKVVAHQAIGMDLETGLLAGLGQRFEKVLPIHIIQIDVLAPVPTTHDVVNGARILHP